MAVSRMASTHDYSIRSLFKRPQDEHGIHAAGAGNTDNLYVSRISQTAASCQVSSCITAPVTAERYNFRFEFFIF